MNYKYPRFLPCALALICSWQIFPVASLFAQEVELPQLPEIENPSKTFSLPEPINVRDSNGNVQLLRGMEDGNLRLSFQNMPDAEAILPAQGRDFTLSVELPANYNELLLEYQRENFRTFLRGLKPTAEPLARFLSISPAQTNFHGIFGIYYKTLIATGRLEEAVELTFQIPWNAVPQDITEMAEAIVQRSIEERAFDQTERLLALFNQNLPDYIFSEMAFRIADALRTEQQHDLAVKVYGSLAQSDNELLRQKSLLWAGYSRSVDDDPAGARAILEMIDPLDRDDENFLTYSLALGRLGYAEDDLFDGLRNLSRAMVLTGVDATFKPELYYLLTTGYMNSGNEVAANRLALEFKIFYPENPWFKKYESEKTSNL